MAFIKNQNSFGSKLKRFFKSSTFSTITTVLLIVIMLFSVAFLQSGGSIENAIQNFELGTASAFTGAVIIAKFMTSNHASETAIAGVELDNEELKEVKKSITNKLPKLDIVRSNKVIQDYNTEIQETLQEAKRKEEIIKLQIKQTAYDHKHRKYKRYARKIEDAKSRTYRIKFTPYRFQDLNMSGYESKKQFDGAFIRFNTKRSMQKRYATTGTLITLFLAFALGSVSIGALFSGGSALESIISTFVTGCFLSYTWVRTFRTTNFTHNHIYLASLKEKEQLIDICLTRQEDVIIEDSEENDDSKTETSEEELASRQAQETEAEEV